MEKTNMALADSLRILGIKNDNPSEQEIKKAWRYKSMILHPDRLPLNASDEMRQRAEDEFKEVSAAYNYLIDLYKNRPQSSTASESQQAAPILEVSPRYIRFKDMAPSQKKTTVIKIIVRGGLDNKISVDYKRLPWITVRGIDSLNYSSIFNQLILEGKGSGEPGEHHSCLINITAENEMTKNRNTVNVKVELWMHPKETNNAETYYNLGYAYYSSGDFGKAIANHTQAIKLDSMLANAYRNRGEAYFHKSLGTDGGWSSDVYWESAIADFNKAIKLDPTLVSQLISFLAESYYKLGLSYFYKGNYNESIVNYNKAIEMDPKLANAYSDRGRAYDEKGYHDKAVADYTMAIKLNPQYADAYFFRGVTYTRMDEKGKAVADFNRATELGSTWKH